MVEHTTENRSVDSSILSLATINCFSFTNFESAKGRDLLENPRAALVFWCAVTIPTKINFRTDTVCFFITRPS